MPHACHPGAVVKPAVPVPRWRLSTDGIAGVGTFAAAPPASNLRR